MSETQALITWTLGTAIAVCTLVGLAVKWILLPYLRDHIATPMASVQAQVKNSHKTNLRDDIDKLLEQGHDLREIVEAQGDVVRVHTRWSEDWVTTADERHLRLGAELRNHEARIAALETLASGSS